MNVITNLIYDLHTNYSDLTGNVLRNSCAKHINKTYGTQELHNIQFYLVQWKRFLIAIFIIILYVENNSPHFFDELLGNLKPLILALEQHIVHLNSFLD